MEQQQDKMEIEMEPEANNEQQESDSDEADDYVPPSNKHTKRNANILFTNGLGFSADNQSQLQTVIESARNKNDFSLAFEPDPSLFCLVYRWAHRPPYNFAADVLNSNSVVAREVGLSSPFDLCKLRG